MPTCKKLLIPATTKSSTRAGFSLLEVMIAIGILGVGLVLIATIFPVGLKMTEQSNNATVGSIIAENGMAVAKTIFTAFDSGKLTAVTANIFDTSTICIDENALRGTVSPPTTWQEALYGKLQAGGNDMRRYRNESKYGFAVLARKTLVGTNRYQITCTAYKKNKTANEVAWMEVQLPDSDSDNEADISDNGTFSKVEVKAAGTYAADDISAWVGSPLIFTKTGDFGIIKAVDKSADPRILILDRIIPKQDSDDNTGSIVEAYVMIEATNTIAMTGVANKSPALYTMTTMTGLSK